MILISACKGFLGGRPSLVIEVGMERWCSEWQAHREHGIAVASLRC